MEINSLGKDRALISTLVYSSCASGTRPGMSPLSVSVCGTEDSPRLREEARIEPQWWAGVRGAPGQSGSHGRAVL